MHGPTSSAPVSTPHVSNAEPGASSHFLPGTVAFRCCFICKHERSAEPNQRRLALTPTRDYRSAVCQATCQCSCSITEVFELRNVRPGMSAISEPGMSAYAGCPVDTDFRVSAPLASPRSWPPRCRPATSRRRRPAPSPAPPSLRRGWGSRLRQDYWGCLGATLQQSCNGYHVLLSPANILTDSGGLRAARHTAQWQAMGCQLVSRHGSISSTVPTFGDQPVEGDLRDGAAAGQCANKLHELQQGLCLRATTPTFHRVQVLGPCVCQRWRVKESAAPDFRVPS